jgi:hypothetical protein
MKIEYTEYIIKKHIPEFLRLRIRKRRKPHHVTSDFARATVAVVIAVEPGGFATQLRRNTRAPSSNRTKTAARWCMAHPGLQNRNHPHAADSASWWRIAVGDRARYLLAPTRGPSHLRARPLVVFPTTARSPHPVSVTHPYIHGLPGSRRSCK